MIVDLFAGTFTCTDCDCRYHAEDMYRRSKRRPTGLCQHCSRDRHRGWYARNTEKAIAYSTAWKRANRERWLDANRKSKHGVPYGFYAEQLAIQGGCCAICKAPEASHATSFHVDHDHATGQIRSLLCDLCNRGLGYFKDNPALLSQAADYLNGWAR